MGHRRVPTKSRCASMSGASDDTEELRPFPNSQTTEYPTKKGECDNTVKKSAISVFPNPPMMRNTTAGFHCELSQKSANTWPCRSLPPTRLNSSNETVQATEGGRHGYTKINKSAPVPRYNRCRTNEQPTAIIAPPRCGPTPMCPKPTSRAPRTQPRSAECGLAACPPLPRVGAAHAATEDARLRGAWGRCGGCCATSVLAQRCPGP